MAFSLETDSMVGAISRHIVCTFIIDAVIYQETFGSTFPTMLAATELQVRHVLYLERLRVSAELGTLTSSLTVFSGAGTLLPPKRLTRLV
jgi:hypothetical protein